MRKRVLAALCASTLFAQHTSSQGWNVELVGSEYNLWGGACRVTASGQYAYVGTYGSLMGAIGSGLRILNVSDPSTPYEVGYSYSVHIARGIDIDENIVYVAGIKGVQYPGAFVPKLVVLDVSDPSNPAELGSRNLPASPNDLVLEGGKAYITLSGLGLSVIDISDPANPMFSGFCDLWDAYGVDVSGNYACVAGDLAGCYVIDVSNPVNPVVISSLPEAGWPLDVEISGCYVYIASSDYGLRIYEITNPYRPSLVGFLEIQEYVTSVSVQDDLVCLGSFFGFHVIDISDPCNPLEIGYYDTHGTSCVMDVFGEYAYTSLDDLGFYVIDISTPFNPHVAGIYSTPGWVFDVKIRDNYAYLANYTAGLRIVDISDLTNPNEVGFLDTPGSAMGIDVVGNYAYMADCGLKIIDISDVMEPIEVGYQQTLDYAQNVKVDGNFAYLANLNLGVIVFDVSIPSSPVQISQFAYAGNAYNLDISGNYAYVAEGIGLEIFNISDPASPEFAGFYATPGSAHDVAVSGSYAYITDGTQGLRVIDITNVSSLVEVGYWDDNSGIAQEEVLSGDYAFIADGCGGIIVLDISNPTRPYDVGFYNTPALAVGIDASGEFAFVADFYHFEIFDCSEAMTNPEVTINIEPLNPPIIIPSSGGSFDFNVVLENGELNPVTFDAWIMVTLRNGTPIGPVLGPINLSLSAGGVIDRDRTQDVPAGAPSGTYSYDAYVGIYPATVWNEDSFNFEKLADGGGLAMTGWANYGESFDVLSTQDMSRSPEDFELLGVYPNPFNPSATISFALPEATKVNLTIYDITGRQVAELVNGWRDAGAHEVTFDASNLTSGIYIARLRADNHSAAQKMILVK